MDSSLISPFRDSLAYKLNEVCIEPRICIITNHRAVSRLKREDQCSGEIVDFGSGHQSGALPVLSPIQRSFKRIGLKLIQEVITVVTNRKFEIESILGLLSCQEAMESHIGGLLKDRGCAK
ncbi:hypothetical protein GCM10019060_41370 [Novosphingobium pokkalii]|nr:hypothetical protein GCM10019060_41370 [Novosphingobium pokkalii]